MVVHIVSETSYVNKGQGVHSAFIEHVKLMKEKNDIGVVVNQEGYGDIFHSHTYGPYYFWKGRKYKGKRIFTAHVIPDSVKGSFPVWRFWMPFVKLYLKKVYSYADVCIAISPNVSNAIRDLGAHTNIVMITNPVRIDRWKRTEEMRRNGRKKLGINSTDFLVMGAGQLEGRKGVDDFLEVAEAMPELKFVWVGGRPFGLMTEGIKRINAKISKASSHIKFTGLLDFSEMPEMYAAADLFLFPSYQENCPLAPLEAAASGMPVIFRDLKEYTTLYEHPYLKAATIGGFIDLIGLLKKDKCFYDEGIDTSKKLVEQFDKNAIRKKLIILYNRLNEAS
ncbi:MAG: glycosyltransferase [Chitinophagaceae bacterium]|nr:MAG: glycosyltransferase [Chitinophagaceae bacterium]